MFKDHAGRNPDAHSRAQNAVRPCRPDGVEICQVEHARIFDSRNRTCLMDMNERIFYYNVTPRQASLTNVGTGQGPQFAQTFG